MREGIIDGERKREGIIERYQEKTREREREKPEGIRDRDTKSVKEKSFFN